MRVQPPSIATITDHASTPATPVADLGNIYLKSLLWLTPTNPFGGTQAGTTIDYGFFGYNGPEGYTIYDPESTVDRLNATDWNSKISPSGSVTLPNGDTVQIPPTLSGE